MGFHSCLGGEEDAEKSLVMVKIVDTTQVLVCWDLIGSF